MPKLAVIPDIEVSDTVVEVGPALQKMARVFCDLPRSRHDLWVG
jgi:hypothetical protein